MNMLASKGPRGSLSLRCQFELEKLALGGHIQKIYKVLLRDIEVVLGIKPVVSKSFVRNNLNGFTPRYIREQRGHIRPFKDQQSANFVKTQLKVLSVKLQTIVQPVFTSRKIAQEFPTSEPKPQLNDQQCVVYNFKCDQRDAGYIGYTRGHLFLCVDGHRSKTSSVHKHYDSRHAGRIHGTTFTVVLMC